MAEVYEILSVVVLQSRKLLDQWVSKVREIDILKLGQSDDKVDKLLGQRLLGSLLRALTEVVYQGAKEGLIDGDVLPTVNLVAHCECLT